MREINMNKLMNQAKKHQGRPSTGGYSHNDRNGQQRTDTGSVDPSDIGMPFYNPYTFIPFPEKVDRKKFSGLTADEREDDRITGVLELKVKTISPLLSVEADPYQGDKNSHKKYHALTIGNDAIVPATSVRGSLRTLMTVLSGGTLGYLDTNIWLCQGRDLQLGPTQANKNAPAILAEVIEPGNSQHSGKIQLGETHLISVRKLFAIMDLDGARPPKGKHPVFIDDCVNPHHYSPAQTSECRWHLKLSGRPVNPKGDKKEGVFLANGEQIPIPAPLWGDYQGRNRFGAEPELKKGDLVWLEPKRGISEIRSSGDIASLQWARWGKVGKSLKDSLPSCVIPDCLKSDAKVDPIIDLWGQVPREGVESVSFASRIRPHNLVFRDAKARLEKEVVLAPLSSPHPGCIAMYRNGSPESISKNSKLNGYKISRNSADTGMNAPWLYSVQGIIENGVLKNGQEQKLNKTVELVQAGETGTLKIGFRALNKMEMALLLQACAVDWKLGGGKPLGLGHCQVTEIRCVSETGDELLKQTLNAQGRMELPPEYAALVAPLRNRVDLYQQSQEPVPNMRYPRSVDPNNNGNRQEGLQWFMRFAALKKTGTGLQPCYANSKSYKGQAPGPFSEKPL